MNVWFGSASENFISFDNSLVKIKCCKSYQYYTNNIYGNDNETALYKNKHI